MAEGSFVTLMFMMSRFSLDAGLGSTFLLKVDFVTGVLFFSTLSESPWLTQTAGTYILSLGPSDSSIILPDSALLMIGLWLS